MRYTCQEGHIQCIQLLSVREITVNFIELNGKEKNINHLCISIMNYIHLGADRREHKGTL